MVGVTQYKLSVGNHYCLGRLKQRSIPVVLNIHIGGLV